jgi:hypothetical protein
MTKTHLLKDAPLKVVSLLIGYGFWHMFGATHRVTTWERIPLTFYNVEQTMKINAPETIDVQLAASRTQLSYIDQTQLAAHIDARTLHEGDNGIDLQNEDLLLPTTIKLVHWRPTNIVVHVAQAAHEMTS